MNPPLRDYLNDGRLLIADGATGTMLMAAGLPPGAPPELWNRDEPEKILALHRAYLDAGSQIILTNSFGGSRLKLDKMGYGSLTVELNRMAGELARQAAGERSYVAGDIGPSGELMAPLGALTYEQALTAFSEQAQALASAGVDALWVETMTDLEEARAAADAALQTGLPVLCSMSFGKKARTMMGVSAKTAAETLWPRGLAAIGLNCGEGLEMVSEVLAQMRLAAPDAPLIVKPNAGLPRLVGAETVYDVSPADFCTRMNEFVAMGAQVIGACCGSNPAFIAALAELAA